MIGWTRRGTCNTTLSWGVGVKPMREIVVLVCRSNSYHWQQMKYTSSSNCHRDFEKLLFWTQLSVCKGFVIIWESVVFLGFAGRFFCSYKTSISMDPVTTERLVLAMEYYFFIRPFSWWFGLEYRTRIQLDVYFTCILVYIMFCRTTSIFRRKGIFESIQSDLSDLYLTHCSLIISHNTLT